MPELISPEKSTNESLDRLAELAGIQAGYRDFFGAEHQTASATKIAVLKAMGFTVETPAAIEASYLKLEEASWKRAIEPVLVVREADFPIRITYTVPAADAVADLLWTIREEGGQQHHGTWKGNKGTPLESRIVDGREYHRRGATLSVRLPLGYHEFRLTADGDALNFGGSMTLIVVPESCYVPQSLATGERVFGLSVQLYSLRSRRNWGVGDFSDLRALAALAREHGIAAIGLNPLHELDPINPAASSPYSPSSRRTISPTYLDVEAIPDYAESAQARAFVNEPAFTADLSIARNQSLIDYTPIVKAKRRVIDLCYASFRELHLAAETPRATAFRDFLRAGGQMFERLCLFNALAERFSHEGLVSWHQWPEPYRNVASTEVADFAAQHREEIEFFAYMQWEAERQLGLAQAACAGMSIGLYCDLAVGVDGSSADTWAMRDIFVSNIGVGAPPDLINTDGQSWGLVPFSPTALRDNAYADFAQLLRANMRHAGALRIDHAMSLLRLYWVPSGMSATDGTYVRYPVEDLLGIVALESQRQRCIVIGEDLGTVPEGFRERLERAKLLSYRLFFFERTEDQGFLTPAAYPQLALASVGTHDLPTLAGFWHGEDLAVRRDLGWALDPQAELTSRAQERERMLDALVGNGDLSSEEAARLLRTPDADIDELVLAAYRYVAKSSTMLVMVQVEDIFGIREAINVPGTVNEQPNWRRRLPTVIEDFEHDRAFLRLTQAMQELRSSTVPPTVPTSTYRIQFHRDFTFRDAEKLVPYLSDLGISHVYASPFLKARSGSLHGYDIIDHNALNSEIGSMADFDRLVAALHLRGMGQVLDFVPNHMGVGGSENAWWNDVLEWGQNSPFAEFFDINWRPARLELRDKVLLPILGDHYGTIMQRGELRLRFSEAGGTFSVWYYSHRLPIRPHDYAVILTSAIAGLRETLGENDNSLNELERIAGSFAVLETIGDANAQRARALELSTALRNLASKPAIAFAVDEAMRQFDTSGGNQENLARLHRLLESQSYKVSYWRAAFDEINYRRFFDVNELAGLRVELAECFALTHRFVFDLIADGRVQGLRIDHIDGLFDPAGYCKLIQSRAEALDQPLYLVVEKIVARHERLRDNWKVDGTTGYEFMNLVNGLFVESDNEERLTRIYRRMAGRNIDYDDMVIECKKRIMDVALASELQVLADELDRIAQQDLYSSDFTRNSLRVALREIVANFPVYRTYITAEAISPDDRRYIDWAVARARKAGALVDDSIFDFIHSILTTDAVRGDDARYDTRDVMRFAMKFQQYTSPVTAKGVEDTCFYQYNRLLSLNEVGGEPSRFGTSVVAFHRACSERVQKTPHALSSTATHDAKRGEDVRTRIDVLSEIPGEWAKTLQRWTRFNKNKKREIDGSLAPDRNDEYFIYQTLLGSWPIEALSDEEPDDEVRTNYGSRLDAYMVKALREAKTHSSWANPDAEYESATLDFVRRILDQSNKSLFLADFLPFTRRLATIGAYSSLSQAVLKLTAPGVPDIYQGTELWDLTLVDPDNRRSVDYEARAALLAQIRNDSVARDAESYVAELLENWSDGRIKMYLTWKTLTLRRERRDAFLEGNYQPLEVTGPRAAHLCAFARDGVVVLAPRLIEPLVDSLGRPPVGSVWAGTRVALPGAHAYRNIFTGAGIEAIERNNPMLDVEEALTSCPVAVLEQILR